MRKLTKRTAVVGTAVVATTSLGIAMAAWTSNGAGSGSAASITSVDSVISTATAGAGMYPGLDTTMSVTITNPNPYPVTVTSISAGASDAFGDCTAGSVHSDASTPGANTIAPNDSADYPLDVHMIASPHDDCKASSFTLPLTATLESAAS